MAKLTWGSELLKNYETGISNGVLYKNNSFSVWNGLISVSKSNTDSSVDEFFYDSRKVYTNVSTGIVQFDVVALSFPDSFSSCLGLLEPRPGFFIDGQNKEFFDFSYKTSYGNDGYKIHLVSNAFVLNNSFSSTSFSEKIDPVQKSFTIATVPQKAYSEKRPSSYFVIDSTKIDQDVLVEVECILYGTSTTDPSFLSQEDFVNLL